MPVSGTHIRPSFNEPGFFEGFFDEKPKAVRTFWRVVNQRLATVTEVAQPDRSS